MAGLVAAKAGRGDGDVSLVAGLGGSLGGCRQGGRVTPRGAAEPVQGAGDAGGGGESGVGCGVVQPTNGIGG